MTQDQLEMRKIRLGATAKAYAKRIEAILPKGWTAEAKGPRVTVRRTEKVDLAWIPPNASDNAKPLQEKDVFEVDVDFAPPVTASQLGEIERSNHALAARMDELRKQLNHLPHMGDGWIAVTKKDKQLVAEFHKVAATYRRPPDGFGEDFSVTFSDAYGLGFILQPAAAGGGKTSDRIVSRLEWAGIQPEEVNDECVGVVKAVKAMFPATAAAAEELRNKVSDVFYALAADLSPDEWDMFLPDKGSPFRWAEGEGYRIRFGPPHERWSDVDGNPTGANIWIMSKEYAATTPFFPRVENRPAIELGKWQGMRVFCYGADGDWIEKIQKVLAQKGQWQPGSSPPTAQTVLAEYKRNSETKILVRYYSKETGYDKNPQSVMLGFDDSCTFKITRQQMDTALDALAKIGLFDAAKDRNWRVPLPAMYVSLCPMPRQVYQIRGWNLDVLRSLRACGGQWTARPPKAWMN